MKKKILVFAVYPSEKNIKDGMIQRIKAIDNELSGFFRVYIDLSWRRFFKLYHEVKEEDMVEVYQLNLFVHFWILLKLLRSTHDIYVHSICNFFNLVWFPLKKYNIVLDVHGVVPEEQKFAGKWWRSFLYELVEKRIFREAKTFIYVSEEMKNFYYTKYPDVANKKNFVKPIFSSNAFASIVNEDVVKLKNELGISEKDVVFVYSGGVQKYQNLNLIIEDMFSRRNENAFFLILTGYPDVVENVFKCYPKYKEIRYVVRSVSPKELPLYYTISHYGYLLRDEHILNQVASPTKMVEYLYYGLMPIVKSEKVGDPYRMGYEYVDYRDHSLRLSQQKSKINKEIAVKMIQAHKSVIIADLF